jgi:hypothetical protein
MTAVPTSAGIEVEWCGRYTRICGPWPADAEKGCGSFWEKSPTGSEGDTRGATKVCYNTHLTFAEVEGPGSDERTMHCGHARGEPPCVDPEWCGRYTRICGPWPADAEKGCRSFWEGAPTGGEGDTSGATKVCYNAHLTFAEVEEPGSDERAMHCGHARGEPPCVEPDEVEGEVTPVPVDAVELEESRAATTGPEVTAPPAPPSPTPSPSPAPELLFGVIPKAREGMIAFAKEYWEILAGAIGSLGVVAYYLHVLKRKTLGEEDVVVERGKTLDGNAVKVAITVRNNSTFKITDIKVTIDHPPAFKVQGGSPTVELGNIRAGEFQSSVFHLVPTRSVKGSVTGSITYENNKGRPKVVPIEPIDLGSVSPALEQVRLSHEEFAQRVQSLIQDSKTVTIRTDPATVFGRIKERFSAIHTVYEVVDPERTTFLGEYAGQNAYSKAFIGAWINVVGGAAEGQVELIVYGEEEASVTGLLSELVELIETKESWVA